MTVLTIKSEKQSTQGMLGIKFETMLSHYPETDDDDHINYILIVLLTFSVNCNRWDRSEF